MAQFNVPVNPTNDPSYVGLSRPISDLKLKSPLGELFEGIGNTFAAAVKGAEIKQHSDIDRTVRDNVDKAQNAIVDDLETSMLKGGRKTGEPAPMSYADEDPANMPSELQTLGADSERYQQAIDSGRGAHRALLDARLHNLGKELRTKYPGQRKFIDDTIADATKNPTNSYIRSLTALLNANQTQDQRTRNRDLTMIDRFPGAPGYKEMRVATINGTNGPEERSAWIDGAARPKATFEELQRRASLGDLSEKAQLKDDERKFDLWVGGETANDMKDITKKLGLEGKGLQDFLRRVQNGEEKNLGERMQPIILELTARRHAMEKRITQMMNEPFEGSTVANRIGGPDAANKRLASHLKLYDDQLRFLQGDQPKVSLATYNAHRNISIREDSKSNVYDDAFIGSSMRAMEAFTGMSPPAAEHFLRNNMMSNPTITGRLQTYLTDQRIMMIAQADKSQGVVHTLNKAIATVKGKGVEEVKAYDKLLGVYSDIADPHLTDEMKLNGIVAAFSEGNKGVTRHFNMEATHKNPLTGQETSVTGKYSVFLKATAPEVAKEVARLSEKYGPEYAQMYVDWVKHEFGTELFRRDIMDMEHINEKNIGIKLGWNTTSKNLEIKPVVYKSGELQVGVGPGSVAFKQEDLRRAQNMVTRINMGLNQLKNLAEAGNLNVEEFLLRNLVELNPRMVRNVEGLPGQLGQALIKERFLEMKAKEDTEKAKGLPKAPGFE